MLYKFKHKKLYFKTKYFALLKVSKILYLAKLADLFSSVLFLGFNSGCVLCQGKFD